MTNANPVEAVVRAAWERRLIVLAVEHAAIAATFVLSGFVILLLVGTQVLSPNWLWLLAIAGAGAAAFQVRKRLLAHYGVAQLLDRRLSLADSISSAWYLLTLPNKRDDFIAHFLLKEAEVKAASVNVAQAFPYTGRRRWSVAGGLAALAVVLFCARYWTSNSLSLHQPLIHLPFGDVMERSSEATGQQKRDKKDAAGADQKGEQNKSQAANRKDTKQPPQPEQPPVGQPNDAGMGQNRDQLAEMRESKDAPNSPVEQRDAKADGAQNANEAENEKQDEQNPAQKDPANAAKSSNGLMDRMKDALSSLAAKMKPSGQSSEQANQQNGEKQKSDSQNNAAKEQKGASKQDSTAQASEQQQSAQGQSQGQTLEKARAGQGKSADPFGDKNKPDSRSGVGSQDGDKELKDAEQLKAMGKLAEILGKRSADASGDMTVEKPSSGQQLKTQYSQRVGAHQDSGGEINRDEIPLAYRQYVRDYMSEIRRTSSKAKKK